MGLFKTNTIVQISEAVANIDVSTKKHQGAVALIDVQDLFLFEDGRGRWRATTLGSNKILYVARREGRRHVFLHRVLLGLEGRHNLADHKNHNGLDNRRGNIRPATHLQNQLNQSSHKDSTSKYLGVSYDKTRGKWRASVFDGGRVVLLGRFLKETDAARAYDAAAKARNPQFVHLNFPEEHAA